MAQDARDYRYDALGRLIESEDIAGSQDGETTSICYDAAGNRTDFKKSTDSSTAGCDQGTLTASPTPTPTSTPTPAPTPTPTSTNSPPIANGDFASGECGETASVNLTGNDTDPEPNYPLTVVAIVRTGGSGTALAEVLSAGDSVSVHFGTEVGTTYFNYTVEDWAGASSTGQLVVNSSNCGGGQLPVFDI